MSSPMADRYEQALAQDPASTVFVELARLHLESGENDRAIAVCQHGLQHHPGSVAARVLWGKALINMGRAAEAMRQFDLATSVDRDNPHAYNLIGEALLRKGLYRSAMPILRKAAALQPANARILSWVEQAKAAQAGGPAPELGEPLPIELAEASRPPPPAASPASPPAPARSSPPVPARSSPPVPSRSSPPVAGTPSGLRLDPDVFAAFTPPRRDPQSDPTEVVPA